MSDGLLQPGQRVRVREDYPPGHIRTPFYIRGKVGHVTRVLGEFMISEGTGPNAFVEYRNLCELGGFDASGPIAVADLVSRVGAGEYRVSAYGFDPRGLRWEVFVRFGEELG